MPPHFSSCAGAPCDIVRSPSGDPWATVGNAAVKICWRPNGDLAFSVRWPHDASRVIERRSADAYKGTPTWRDSCDSSAVTCEAPFDDPAIETDDRAGIRRLTPWIPHSSINKAGLWWRSSQDAQTSRWILLSQFIVQIDWFITMGQGNKHKSKSGKPRETARREEPETAQGWWSWWTVYKSRARWRQWGWKHSNPENSQNRSQIDRISRSQRSSANN